ncbi:MAG: hypothetical protein PHR81_02150 [Bacteroidales bacterium]|nr:hypothetical protein [Bacteroidales bacterium]MDD4213592.1 hypothetical protein [Bacteroidales bacterium]
MYLIRKCKYWITLVFFFCFVKLVAQENVIPVKCDSVYYVTLLDSLKKSFSNCINIPEEFELSFYTAISHYPELKEIHIDMKLKQMNFSMAARPAKKLFAERKKRGYRIYANIKKNFKGILPVKLSYNQKVGILGHELAHILDYTNKSLCRMVGTGLGYMFIPYRRKLEAATDLEAIKHGLGWQIYDYENYIMNLSEASEKYKNKKRKIYLNEKQIKEIIIKYYPEY